MPSMLEDDRHPDLSAGHHMPQAEEDCQEGLGTTSRYLLRQMVHYCSELYNLYD